MTDTGTPSQGKKSRTTHIKCRRCGEKSYYVRKRIYSSYGFGKSKKRWNHA